MGRRILGKPSDRKEASSFLSLLSGRRHKVITCVAVKKQNQVKVKDVISVVKMKVLSFQEIEAYLDSGDWEGKAGGYGIQGPAASFIPWISGSYTGIVGLPLTETMSLLGSLNTQSSVAKMVKRSIVLDHFKNLEASALVVDGVLQDFL